MKSFCLIFITFLSLQLISRSSQAEINEKVRQTSEHDTSGPFTIIYDKYNLPSIRVFHETTGLVWFTSTSFSPFVYVEKVKQDVLQIGGDYTIEDILLDTCTAIEVTDFGKRTNAGQSSTQYPTVFLKGVLCDEVPFELTFQAVSLNSSTQDESRSHYRGRKHFTQVNTTHHHLKFNLSMEKNPHYNQLRLVYGCDKDEQFYGFGAQYSKFNLKGERFPVFLSEQGVGRGLEPFTSILNEISPGAGGTWYTTYTCVPHYITSHHRSLLLESLEYAVFDLTEKDTVVIELDSSTMTGRIIPGQSSMDLINSYTAFVGRLKPLPDWVGKGAVLGLQGGRGAVLDTISQVEKEWGNLSDVAAVWLQDWTGQRNFSGTNELPRVGLWWNWEVDEKHYPQWNDFIAMLSTKQIRTLIYINPLFSNITARGTPFKHNYYQEGVDKDYFVKTSDGVLWSGYSNGSLLDLSKPEAYQWMVDIIVQNMLQTGVCGWMCDFGESVPLDALMTPHLYSAAQYHSLYPSLWGQANADAIKKASEIRKSTDHSSSSSALCSADDVVYFMRSGNIYSPSVTRSFWLGDQMVTWDSHDGLATVVIGMLSGSISGYSHTHSDIGGYTAIIKFPFSYIRSKDLYLRWCELAAFTTMYRSHLGTLPTRNWQFNSDNETLQHFFKMAVVFQSWDFYRRQLLEEASRFGWPVARHMMLVFPNNTKVYQEDLKLQFMLGTELLVAPVVTEGQKRVSVFLPADTQWVNIWSENEVIIKGGDEFIEVNSPLGQPCVLFQQGSKVGGQFVENLKARGIIRQK